MGINYREMDRAGGYPSANFRFGLFKGRSILGECHREGKKKKVRADFDFSLSTPTRGHT